MTRLNLNLCATENYSAVASEEYVWFVCKLRVCFCSVQILMCPKFGHFCFDLKILQLGKLTE